MMKYNVLPIHIFNENQIAVEVPRIDIDENGNKTEIWPDGIIDVDLEYPPHLYTWEKSGNKIKVILDDAKYQAYLEEFK